MEDQEPLVIPAMAVQEGLLRWISANGPGRRVGAGIGRTVVQGALHAVPALAVRPCARGAGERPAATAVS
jgi:hypothetical protein